MELLTEVWRMSSPTPHSRADHGHHDEEFSGTNSYSGYTIRLRVLPSLRMGYHLITVGQQSLIQFSD
jgi:hypothetical protein